MVKYNLGLLEPLALDNHIALAINGGINGVGAFPEVEYYSIFICGCAAQVAQLHGQVATYLTHVNLDGLCVSNKGSRAHEQDYAAEFYDLFHRYPS